MNILKCKKAITVNIDNFNIILRQNKSFNKYLQQITIYG